MARFNRQVLIALGVHEFENDDLLALGVQVESLCVIFCPAESELSLTLVHHTPDAVCLCAAWSEERLNAVLQQLRRRDGRTTPVFLCGPASELSLASIESFEIHRLSTPAPTADMLLRAWNDGKPDVREEPPSDEVTAPPLPDSPFFYAPLEHASLPRFIGGIAHDFNNLLAAIIGDVQLASSRTTDPVVSKHLERANDACFRMAGEIRRLLAFQEGATERRGLVEIGHVLREINHFIPELLGQTVEVETVQCPTPLWVEGSVSGLRQILTNLIGYASQQVESGRIIRLGVRRDDSELHPFVGAARTPRTSQALIEVEVRNSKASPGFGVPAFEPVFSRPVRDAGVSLAIVWKLVQDFHGTVSVLHGKAGTAAFRVLLPLAHPAQCDPVSLMAGLRGTETLILVSTDRTAVEPILRDARDLGYSVELHSDLSQFRDSLGQLFDTPACVLIDTDCELVDASEVHHIVREVDTRLPILLAAPELAGMCHPPFSNDGLTCLVHKPMDIKEVLSTVRALLTRPAIGVGVSPGGK